MIKAVLFDCDGLMFETELISITMWKLLAKEHHVILPDDFFVQITGSGKGDKADYIASIDGIERILPKVSQRRFDLDVWKNCAKDSLNKPGLIELFEYLENKHYKIAICSSSHQEYVKTLVNTVSVPLNYDVLVTGDMVQHAKPDPEVFLKGAALLGVLPEECLVLEDSKMGVLAASKAGMHHCWIPDMIEADDEMLSLLEYKKNDLTGVIDILEELQEAE